jgi:hypothetical protein
MNVAVVKSRYVDAKRFLELRPGDVICDYKDWQPAPGDGVQMHSCRIAVAAALNWVGCSYGNMYVEVVGVDQECVTAVVIVDGAWARVFTFTLEK